MLIVAAASLATYGSDLDGNSNTLPFYGGFFEEANISVTISSDMRELFNLAPYVQDGAWRGLVCTECSDPDDL